MGKKSISPSFWVHAALKSCSKYTTSLKSCNWRWRQKVTLEQIFLFWILIINRFLASRQKCKSKLKTTKIINRASVVVSTSCVHPRAGGNTFFSSLSSWNHVDLLYITETKKKQLKTNKNKGCQHNPLALLLFDNRLSMPHPLWSVLIQDLSPTPLMLLNNL